MQIEDILLRHSGRGMQILKEYLEEDYCRRAAQMILSWKQGTVLLTTGFYVAGFGETDGPAGTVVLAGALGKLGYRPVVVTDRYCRGFFEAEGLDTEYADIGAGENDARQLLRKHVPVGLISIERCGINIRGDYENMRGVSIREHTAPLDLLFQLSEGKIPSIGIGDGGNEIGMGNLKEVISGRLSLVPCRVRTDRLIVASVSNWGAYGLTAWLQSLTGKHVFPEFGFIEKYIEETVRLGSVDGVTRQHTVTVDGFDMSTEREIVEALGRAAALPKDK